MEKKRIEITGAVITAVTSTGTIKDIAEERGINPQEVFVRVTFKTSKDSKDEYQSSNKLKFFGKQGYEKLLKAKEAGTPVNLAITISDKGNLCYLCSDNIAVDDLFAEPVEQAASKYKDVLDLF